MEPADLCKNNTEDGHQMALFLQAKKNENKYPMTKWMFAIPNGGNRSASQGAKMKATGTKKGVWDIFLPVPVFVPALDEKDEVIPGKGSFLHGLFIEMKRPGDKGRAAGRLSKEQVQFQKHCQVMGYAEAVAYTWEEAWMHIEGYLSFCTPEQVTFYRQQLLPHTTPIMPDGKLMQ